MINSIQHFQEKGVKNLTEIFSHYTDDLTKFAEMVYEVTKEVTKLGLSLIEEELESYEEERRLFYVGITRAKNQLNVFTMKPQSSDFCDELFGRKVPKKPMEIPKRATAVNQLKAKREQPKTISDVAYQYFLDQLGVGTVVEHKKFGEGVIAEMEKGKIWIAFEEGTKSF